jgi:hypothetical protein
MASLPLLSASSQWDFFDNAWPPPTLLAHFSIHIHGGEGAGRPAWTIWRAAAPNWQPVALHSTAPCVCVCVSGGINCMCLVVFNTAAAPALEMTPTSQSAAARMDQCMHGTDHTCICMHACMRTLAALAPLALLVSLQSKYSYHSLSHHRGTFPPAHPCHSCFLGISLSLSLSLSLSQLAAGAAHF